MWPLSLILLITLSLASTYDSKQLSLNVEKFIQCVPMQNNSDISSLIYTPKDTSFLTILHSYNRNLRFQTPQTPKPLLIITPSNQAQVPTIVACAKSLGLPLRIRSGGHDYEGLSYRSTDPFILLDMFNLRNIDILQEGDDYFAWMEAGAIMGELYHRVSQFSPTLAFPGGVCPTMAAGGHFSGGGYGNLMRKFGLSVDNIVDALIVDASGALLSRESMGEDLFWAIRGGGAASFGVVIGWKLKLVSIPETVTVFNVMLTKEQGALDATHRWQFVAPNLPGELFIRAMHNVIASTNQEGNHTIRVSFIGMFLGNAKSLIPLMDKNFPELGLKQSDYKEIPWIESTMFWYNIPIGTPIDTLLERPKNGSYNFKSRSDYVKKPIPKDGIEAIWETMVGFEDTHLVMQWNPYGGKMWEVAESATPFPHRAGNLFLIQYPLSWMEQGQERADYYTNMSMSLHKFMTPFVSSSPRESFLNYRDLDIGANSGRNTKYEDGEEFGRKYFKGNFDRLMKVKTMVDPDNFFRYEQSIPLLKDLKIKNL